MSPIVPRFRHACAGALIAWAAVQPSAVRAANDFAQKPEGYICPNASGDAIECYLDAIPHLYTMCRQVKSIEILEFGYENAEQGVNGAKSEYCVDKHRQSITRHFQAALRAATNNRAAVEALRALQDYWQKSLVELKWQPQESDSEYKARVAKPYDVFAERTQAIRTALANAKSSPKHQATAKSAAAAKSAPATKSASTAKSASAKAP